MSNNEIDILNIFLSKLEEISPEEQSIDYQQIVKLVQDFIKKNCKHVIVMDLIDIDPDRSETILYCTKCGMTIPGYSEKTNNNIFWEKT
jgi:hypothetical protein